MDTRQERHYLVTLDMRVIIAKVEITLGKAPRGYTSTFTWKTHSADCKIFFYKLVPTQKCVFYVKSYVERLSERLGSVT